MVKRNKRGKRSAVLSSEKPSRWKIFASVYHFLFFFALSLVSFALSSLVNTKLWIVIFVLLGFIFAFLSLAFLIVWLVYLFLLLSKR